MSLLGSSAESARLSLGNVGQRTAHEAVVETLRGAILGGELPGGTRLVQSELASRLGVSITPVREAIRQLATEGLIRLDSYRGAMVLTPELEEIQEVYELLLVLTPLATRKAVEQISDSDLHRARQLMGEMARTADTAAWVLLNRQFHAVLYGAARSPRLLSILTTLSDTATAQVAISLRNGDEGREASNADHMYLLESFERRDVERAVEATRRHLERGRDTLVKLKGENPAG
ncbi:GntR family transcriptional regulator [Streptomyces sp. NPDC004838]